MTIEEKYYKQIKEKYQTKEAVLTEIINLSAICELPKGTEHFVSDLHGEFIAFDHVLRNASGKIKEKIVESLPELTKTEVSELAVLIYYPKEKLERQAVLLNETDLRKWQNQELLRLLHVAKYAADKYTRSKVRKALPENFQYILEELLSEIDSTTSNKTSNNKVDYFQSIIDKIFELNRMEPLIEALATAIRRMTVDHLHVAGDIFDRGPSPDLIIDRLMTLPSVDIQWGNHDITWMAIMAGSKVAMMNVIRICARYGNLETIEESYGINLRPLVRYAEKYYQASPGFAPKLLSEEKALISDQEKEILCLLQEATAILQFKLESQLIHRRPEFHLEHRDLLQAIDYEKKTVNIAGQDYPLIDFQAPTINPEKPEELTKEEEELIRKLMFSFQASEKLHRHIDFLLSKGSMYLCYNDNLIIHGCLPLHGNGDLKSVHIAGKSYSGRALLDFYDQKVRESMKNPQVSDDFATDLMWYLWIGESSSLFGKDAMTTFERYYIADKKTHVEHKNAYYSLRNDKNVVKSLLKEFGLAESGHIINGHTPVKEKDGENPIKASGHLIVIDGGFSKPYQKETGIAGYTLLSNSYGMQLVAHQPFLSVSKAVKEGTDIVSTTRLVDQIVNRTKVKDTSIGKKLQDDIKDLEQVLKHFEEL